MSPEEYKMEKLQPLITKMNGWANFLHLSEISVNQASKIQSGDAKDLWTLTLEAKVAKLEQHLLWALNSVIESQNMVIDLCEDEDESFECEETKEYAEDLITSLGLGQEKTDLDKVQ